MNELDPEVLFNRIANDVSPRLHAHVFVTGSLAAAYSFRTRLEGRAVNTKDADLVVHPAGDVVSCQELATELLSAEWSRTDECLAQPSPEPTDQLRAIRLFPPKSRDYFIEFLGLPEVDQLEAKRWVPMQLVDGWYGLPCFRFMGLTMYGRLRSTCGLEYAAPAMMALANLLSHPTIGTARIESGTMKGVLRSAKDLGRVLALAHLAGRNATETWLALWRTGIIAQFPDRSKELAAAVGNGLRELLGDDGALEEAQQTTDIGLLNGLNVTADSLKAIGARLLGDVIEPLADEFA